MIAFYQFTTNTTPNSKYSHISSNSRCSNCATIKRGKGNRREVELGSEQFKTVTDYESGEIICSTCGMVISDKIQSIGPEWRNFEQSGTAIAGSTESNTSRQRTGSPISLARYDKGLYTVIGEKDNDVYGRRLDPLVRHSMHKVRMYDVRSQLDTHNERNRRRAFADLDRLRGKLGLSDFVVEKTAYIYRKAEKRGIIRGRTIDSILASSLYIACREMSVPKTLKEIAKASNIRLKTLSRDYRMLIKELDLKVPNNDLRHYIFKVGNAVPISEKTKRKAIELVDVISKKENNTYTSGKDPMGLAATVLFVAGANNGENVTQREVATAAGMTSVTIRCRLKEIGKYLDSLQTPE
jgi:transcription initiation factor TFIIB